MIRRRFGRTNLQMPVFSCGGMRYQSAWKDDQHDQIEQDNQRNLEATIERSLALGINHIETARGYGTSEYQLGKILPRLPRERMIVQTKVPPRATASEFRELLQTSFERLQLDYVDLLGIHGLNNAEMLDMALAKNGPIEVVREYQRDGRIRHVGFSTHGLPETIIRAIESGEFDYVNLHWYYMDQRNWPAIEAATKRDMGVFIISPSDKGGKLYEPPEKLVDLCRPFTPMGFNDLFCLSHPQVHTLSLGAARPTDFDAHVEILPHVNQAADAIKPIRQRLDQELRQTWGDTWTDHWHEGIPHWDQVPGHVNIYQILRLYTLAKAFDMTAYGKMRYNMLGNGGHWFPGQKIDQLDWDNLPALLAASPVADQIPDVLREAHAALNAEEVKRLSESDD